MAEYIEREATCRDCFHYDVCDYHITELTPMTVNECSHKFVNKADVVEVRHGEWLDNGDRDINGVVKPFSISCSVCGSSDGTSWMRYCPNCGAKMDGKDT